jgi:NADPH:quinone reductase-like Zn-dependent oxidoreductase
MDCIGTIPVYRNCAKYLKPNRPYIAVGIDLHGLSTLQTMKTFLTVAASVTLPTFLGGVPRKFGVFTMKYDGEALKKMADAIDQGILHVPIDSEYGWEKEDVMKAYDLQMSARVSVSPTRNNIH